MMFFETKELTMKKYKSVEVTEKQLEDLIRQGADLVEDELRYIDHQKMTDRGPLDIVLVDSGGSLVIAELKIVEDDTMLVQGIDYYDYVSRNIEGLARAHSQFEINPEQDVRLFLIAPSFSVSLLNRCKWIDIPISLFSYKCVKFDGSEEITPIFNEVSIPSVPKPEKAYKLEDRLNYITSADVRKIAEGLMREIRSWDEGNISVDVIKYDISLKFSGSVLCYLAPRRKFFHVYTNNQENKWTAFPVHQEEDLETIKALLKANIDKLR